MFDTRARTQHIDAILLFLSEIGLMIEEASIEAETVLPGIGLRPSGLIVDRDKLSYPGDLLHEAGHLAVMTPEEREATGQALIASDKSKMMGDEIAAIAWSYAAVVHIGLDPSVLFHADGYHDSSDWFIDQYTGGNPIGLPLLQWMGLAYDTSHAQEHNTEPYPHMIRWLRQ